MKDDCRLGLLLGWMLCGCTIATSNDTTTVEIRSVTATPASVADGASFVVAWDISYANGQGLFTELGLYLGMAGDLTSAAARDMRALFSLADTAAAPTHPGSMMSCTRTGTSVRCADGSSVEVPLGAVALTFRLCSENVLDATSQVCATRPVSITFP